MAPKRPPTRALRFPNTRCMCICNASMEGAMPQKTAGKQRTNVALTASILAEPVHAAKAEAWARENAEAMAEQRAWIEARGTPLADLQVLTFDRWGSSMSIPSRVAVWCSLSRRI